MDNSVIITYLKHTEVVKIHIPDNYKIKSESIIQHVVQYTEWRFTLKIFEVYLLLY